MGAAPGLGPGPGQAQDQGPTAPTEPLALAGPRLLYMNLYMDLYMKVYGFVHETVHGMKNALLQVRLNECSVGLLPILEGNSPLCRIVGA